MPDFKVPIRNILFIYSYAWDYVDCQKYLNLAANDNFSSLEILTELFLLNLHHILRHGLYRTYQVKHDTIPVIRGRVDYKTTFTQQTYLHGKISCAYDEFTENNIYNQILKSTILRLYKLQNSPSSLNLSTRARNKKQLYSSLLYFSGVDYLELSTDVFHRLEYNHHNKHYRMIMKICELIFHGKMLSSEAGEYNFLDLVDEKTLHDIFEKFVRNFYVRELPKPYITSSIARKLDYGFTPVGEDSDFSLIPDMKTDTYIDAPDETIVLDTKFYAKPLESQREEYAEKLISGNIYQVFTYINHIPNTKKVRGILLYPMPKTRQTLNVAYRTEAISSHNIIPATMQFNTLDLSQDWPDIKRQLLNVILS